MINHNYLELENHRVHYQHFGKGDKILIAFHGFADDSGIFNCLEESLGKHYQVFSFDAPFHGKTQWATNRYQPKDWVAVVKALVEQEGIERFGFLAHSMGGRFVQALLPHFTEQTEELLLIAPAGLRQEIIYNKMLLNVPIREFLKWTLLQPFWFLSMLRFVRRMGWIHQSFYQFIELHFSSRHRIDRLFDTWISLYHFPIQPRKFESLIRDHALQLRLIYGKTDRITPVKDALRFVQDLPDAQVFEVPGDHFLLRASLNQPLLEILGEPSPQSRVAQLH